MAHHFSVVGDENAHSLPHLWEGGHVAVTVVDLALASALCCAGVLVALLVRL